MYLTHFPTETMPENGWPSFRVDPNLSVCVYKQDHPQTENAAEGGGIKCSHITVEKCGNNAE